MKQEKQPSSYLWQIWKNVLAVWATIVIFFTAIASIFGIEPINLDSLYQVKFYFLFAATVPLASAYFSLTKTSHLTKSCRNILIIVLFAVALIFGIVWLIYAETLRQHYIFLWALCSLIPLSLITSAASMLTYERPRQPEDLLRKAQEKKQVPDNPKDERAKIIEVVALLVLILAIVLTRKKRN